MVHFLCISWRKALFSTVDHACLFVVISCRTHASISLFPALESSSIASMVFCFVAAAWVEREEHSVVRVDRDTPWSALPELDAQLHGTALVSKSQFSEKGHLASVA